MFRAAVYNGLVNVPWDDHTFKNSEYLLSTFGVNQELNFHEGCVNTITWDENGEYLLSGSDDRKIAIIQVFDGLTHAPGEVLFSRKLPSESNIFVARFLRNTNNQQIIVGFKCGCVLHTNTSDASEKASIVCCHECAVYDILTPPDQPHCFVTVSHDRTVRIFDTRERHTSLIHNREHCSHRCSFVEQARQMDRKTSTSCINRMAFKFPVTAGDVHPLDGCRSMAFGFADGFVRLFDIRKLSTGASSAIGDTSCPLAYRVARPVDMPSRIDDNRNTRCDYGPAYITSVKFEPVYRLTDRRLPQLSSLLGTSMSRSAGARCLLVSHMYAPVYLFDVGADEVVKCTDAPPPDWLPPASSGSGTPSNGTASGRNSEQTPMDYRRAMALIYWLNSRHMRRNRTTVDATETPSGSVANSSQPAASENDPSARGEDAADDDGDEDGDGDDQDEPEVQQREGSDRRTDSGSFSYTSPLSLLTDAYVAKVLSSAPRCRQLMAYQGRVSCRTVIKSAVFWGRDHILSGSECGHVIAWNRWTGSPVCAVKADRSAVNRIEPHPRLPLFACSGIDKTIKIVESIPPPFQSGDEDTGDNDDGEDDEIVTDFRSLSMRSQTEASRLCFKNAASMRDTLASGTTVLERLIQFNIARAIRSIRSRLPDTSSTSGEPS